MIDVLDLKKHFDGFAALDGATLHARKGAVYGLVGPNGAGKTTLIKHLNGVLKQDSGQVMIDGEPVFENERIKQRCVCIPDDLYYFMQAGIGAMMRYYRGIYKNFSMERYNKLREAFSLNEKTPIRRFSKGMQKQAAFWLAMSCCPDVLILDEPVDGLDPVMRRQIWSILLNDVAEREMTVLVSSHNLRELEDVCDDVGIMDKGQVVIERSLSELQGNVIKVQLVLPEVAELPGDLKVLHTSQLGRIQTVIVRGTAEEVEAKLKPLNPVLVDILPLTLEEIFIYEMGGADYAVKDILL